MLDPKTRRFLKVLQSEDGKWVPGSNLTSYGINVDSLNIGHLLDLNYINEIVHLEEQYRITPTGESALLEHKRAWRSDIKSTIALILSAIAILVSLVGLLTSGQPEPPMQGRQQQQTQQAIHREEYRASVWDFFPA